MMTIDDMLSEVARLTDAAPAPDGGAVKVSSSDKKAEIKKPDSTACTDDAAAMPQIRENKAAPAVGMKLTLTLALAKEIAYCIERAAQAIGVNAVTAVTDAGGKLILLEAMDDSFIASTDAAREKAYTAVALKMPTHTALKESRGGALDGYTNGGGILMLGGGYPVIYEGAVIGGIGVSGGTSEQDMLLARVGTEYFKKRIVTF